MKTLLAAGGLALILFCSSCGEKESAGPPGSFDYDGKAHPLMNGFLIPGGTLAPHGTTYYQRILVLASDGITYDNNVKEFAGQGDLMYFDLYAYEDSSRLADGVYSWTGHQGEDIIGNLGIYLNYDGATGTGQTAFEDAETATVGVTHVGEVYSFEIDVHLNYTEVKGSFKGKLQDLEK